MQIHLDNFFFGDFTSLVIHIISPFGTLANIFFIPLFMNRSKKRPASGKKLIASAQCLLLCFLILPAYRIKAFPIQKSDSLKRITVATVPDTIKVRAWISLSTLYLDSSIILSLQYAETATNLAKRNSWKGGIVLAEIAAASCYDAMRQNEQASQHYRVAINEAKGLKDSTYLFASLYALSELFAHTHQRDSELYYKQRSLQLAIWNQDTIKQARVLHKLGYYYDYEGNYPLAVQYWKQCIAILSQTPYRTSEALLWGNLSEAYQKMHQPDSARNAISTGLQMVKVENDPGMVMFLNLCLTEFYNSRHSWDSGIVTAKSVLVLARNQQNLERIRDSYDLLAQLHEQKGEASLALNEYKQFIVFRDSLAHEERTADEAKKIQQSAYNNTLAAITKKHGEERMIYRRRLYVIAGMAACILLLVSLTVFLYRSSRANRHKAAVIRKQNKVIRQSLHEKEVLLKEIHHRVKNNLQIITALQQMQAARSDNPAVKGALEDSQNRVLSIAFIHQNLYQHDDLAGVEMLSFVRELSAHILDVCTSSEKNIRVEQNIAPVTLDIDTAVPLGLILNELFTNSCKHAFKEKNKGRIFIRLWQEAAGNYALHYEDDGPGLPDDIDFERTDSLGLRLIRQISRQLEGRLSYSGSRCILLFKDFEERNRD